MRFNHKAILFSSIILGSVAIPAVAATFEVPTSFQIMYVDLQPANNFGGDFKVNVKAGHHQFVVRYNQTIRHGKDSNNFQSQPIIIETKVSKDAVLTLKAPHFYFQRKAKKFADKPDFTIVTADGKKANYHQQMLPLKPGFQPTRNYVQEIRRFEGDTTDGYDAPAPAPKEIADSNEFTMMKFWYNKSDVQTRKDIRIWMIDHSHKPAEAKNEPFNMLKFWYNKASKAQRKAFQVWLLQ
ncbi:YccT family protein [Celerinatantimonas diazotrophica]|uniref:Uncharacterized protein n=1 Tax=Celerinatantimonas diazotrophica TaxID=412034 RepID=A0A4R1J7T0_9GAMM|nr:DUF2057 domain-containing protein [Celerinatantimonas diazotrophica]TCK46591.1 hypothetical protein EV690_3542 [Celerinatantimonas diazotrophica]CAG9296641.1 hypothetical protein CEDIAZO_01795 [Celerinatantimonas diazotrophica]